MSGECSDGAEQEGISLLKVFAPFLRASVSPVLNETQGAAADIDPARRQVQQQIPCGDDNKKKATGSYAVLMIVILLEGIRLEARFCTGYGLRGVSAYKTASIRFETPSLS
jgi:hypothetical protein